jgi:hypothetical protein
LRWDLTDHITRQSTQRLPRTPRLLISSAKTVARRPSDLAKMKPVAGRERGCKWLSELLFEWVRARHLAKRRWARGGGRQSESAKLRGERGGLAFGHKSFWVIALRTEAEQVRHFSCIQTRIF